jgi:acyl carrier protein
MSDTFNLDQIIKEALLSNGQFEGFVDDALNDSGFLSNDTNLKDYGLDSLGMLDLLMKLEELLGIRIVPENLLTGEFDPEEFVVISDLKRFVETKLDNPDTELTTNI